MSLSGPAFGGLGGTVWTLFSAREPFWELYFRPPAGASRIRSNFLRRVPDGGWILDPILDPRATRRATAGDNFAGSNFCKHLEAKIRRVGSDFRTKMRPQREANNITKTSATDLRVKILFQRFRGNWTEKGDMGARQDGETAQQGRAKNYCKL